ncbi:calsenilin isoform X4 [Callithrix jacchus]
MQPAKIAVTVSWSCPRCATSQRGWTNCRPRPSSPRRSCSPSTGASRMSVPRAWWMKTPSNSFTHSSSLREMPAPMHTSSSTPSTPTGTGPSTLRTLWLASPSCFGAQSTRSSSGPLISTTLTRMATSPKRYWPWGQQPAGCPPFPGSRPWTSRCGVWAHLPCTAQLIPAQQVFSIILSYAEGLGETQVEKPEVLALAPTK